MPIELQREPFDPTTGFQYYMSFRPHESGLTGVFQRVPVEAVASIGEMGELADLTFTVPKRCRNEEALTYLQAHNTVSFVSERVFIAFPGLSGDAVMRVNGFLDMDPLGRIVGMEIRWKPREP